MEDLKKYLEIDNNKLYKSLSNIDKLGKLSFISSEFDYWKNLFTYSEKRTNIENFLLFKTASKLNLYKEDYNDPDATFPALEYLKNNLYKIESVDRVEIGKEIDKKMKSRAFLATLKGDKKIYLESDTANSLMTDLGNYLRIIMGKYIKLPKGKNWAEATYMKKYGLKQPDEALRNFYWYTLISRLQDLLKEDADKDCYALLEQRAGLTHTLKNVILVPYGYNTPRGFSLKTYKSNIKICDRLDLTIKDFNEMVEDAEFNDEILQKRLKCEDEKCSVDTIKFLLENKKILFPEIPIYETNLIPKTIEKICNVTKNINNTLEMRYE